MATKTIAKTVAEQPEQVDLMKIYLDFAQKYDNVFIFQADEKVFIYRSLGRGEFKKIVDDKRFNDYQKEEVICSQCLLYPDPDNIYWDNEDAGIPTRLSQEILAHSYLDSLERRRALHDYYRTEMYDLDNQISCIIQEAFPMLRLEEIEDWDVDKTTKMLSRAEWKLKTLRGLDFIPAEGEFTQEEHEEPQEQPAPQQKKRPQPRQEEPQENEVVSEEDFNEDFFTPASQAKTAQKQSAQRKAEKKTIRGGSKNDKLTPDKMKAYQELVSRFPQFAGDDIMINGIDGLAQPDVDDRPAAARPPKQNRTAE